MKAGVIGLGKMGMLHTGILNTFDDVDVVCIAEKENFLAKYIKKAMPTVSVYNDYEKMLSSQDLDILFITTPTPSHYLMVLSCIRSNVDFFVEKPLAKNLNEAQKICSNLKNSNIIHSVGFNARYVATFSKLKKLLDSNVLGDLSTVKSSMFVSNIFSKPSGWRFKKNSGGVLLEFGCHMVDLLSWYFGKVNKVNAYTKSLYTDVDDFAHLDMEFENGMRGEFETSWSVKGYRIFEDRLEITGSNGKIIANQDYIDIKIKEPVSSLTEKETRIYKQSLDEGVSFDVGESYYTKEDREIIDCVKAKKLPLANVFEASKAQSIIQAAYDSAKSKSECEVRYLE